MKIALRLERYMNRNPLIAGLIESLCYWLVFMFWMFMLVKILSVITWKVSCAS